MLIKDLGTLSVTSSCRVQLAFRLLISLYPLLRQSIFKTTVYASHRCRSLLIVRGRHCFPFPMEPIVPATKSSVSPILQVDR